ncbi:uncharacterized protein SPPG_08345 [Spizellomyces punctatus DAOM BR117]|uniref:Uncharacterized protein n=1 Tax=Spizellomyces punctatus (strain DAOM BR117) TaxID=645134 RepID=A0A0L0H5L3_SPIPD|nr:uncharacterized protein SPPG_08345 [Spizellomyces punctatus DAOM BR117]KNC96191.1 hypothetical protein SPPG_08345 [Spizellomyces punctatus DAOM BR117]|eukprot:XP_016604231.1 hypothetical protein SPPG_08345 [Spizellomyces punctatus DAOM BR117]
MPSDCSSDLSQITPNLFLSGVGPAQNLTLLKENSITHILGIGLRLQPKFPNEVTYKHVSLEDDPQVNIMRYFPDTYRFIDEAVKANGRVLVHCVAGISRSATIVIAYFMKSEGIGLYEAQMKVKSKRRIIHPNSGFVKQLKLFEAMRCELDMSHQPYRQFLTTKTAQEKTGKFLMDDSEHASISTLETSTNSTTSSHPDPSDDRKPTSARRLRCKKCRADLLSDKQLVEHESGAGQAAFGYRKRAMTLTPTVSQCASYHIEPVEWIKGVNDGELEGKIVCPNPKCEAKLGAWSWAGAPCSCGAWVAPSFSIHRNKVDESFSVPAE